MQYNVLVPGIFVGFFVCFCFAQKGELNDPCHVFSECRRFAYLCSKNRTCQCIAPYRPNKYRDKCVGIIGGQCEYDEHCIEGAFCKGQKICECKHDLFPTEDNTECSHSTRNIPTKYTIIPVLISVYMMLFFWIS